MMNLYNHNQKMDTTNYIRIQHDISIEDLS